MTDQQTDLRVRADEYDADRCEDAGYIAHYAAEAETDHYVAEAGTDYDAAEAGGDAHTWESSDDWDSPADSPDDWDALDDWDTYVASARPATSVHAVRPWYRDPRWLFALIALAAAALVVATVLLVTGRGSGEIPTAPELATRTPASTPSTPSPRSAPPRESTASSSPTPTSASPGVEEPSAVDIPAPVEPTASPTEAPPESPALTQSKSPAGPRINVTRTPMSFSPGNR